MTCIATDGKIMVADGLECMGDVRGRLNTPKMFHAKDGSVVGCAGHSAAIALVRRWFEGGEPKDTIPSLPETEDKDTPFIALVLRPSGLVQWVDYHFAPIDSECPGAIGSGWNYALAAMRLGKGPREAVEFAAEHIISVGGEISEMTPRPPARKPKRKR